MRARLTIWWAGIVLLLAISALCQQDSLQSALNALDRRERDLTEGPLREYADVDNPYSKLRLSLSNDPEDLNYLSNNEYSGESEYPYGGRPLDNIRDPAVGRAILDFLDEENYDGNSNARYEDDIRTSVSSSFRERMEEDREKEYEKMLLKKLEDVAERDEDDDKSEDYQYMRLKKNRDERLDDGIGNFRWKANNRYAQQNDPFTAQKRSFPEYSSLGWGSIGMRKRSPEMYLQNYPVDQQIQDVDYDEPSRSWYDGSRQSRFMASYSMKKRFPVSKRSSGYYKPAERPTEKKQEVTHQHKRSSKKENASGTDPKIIKDLSNIFGVKDAKPNANNDTKKKATAMKPEKLGSPKMTKTVKSSETKTASTETSHVIKKSQEEVVSPQHKEDEPLDIKKKSIEWSNYFGLDRKKKSSSSPDNSDVDNEWLMERYHKAVALTTKRNAEFPLKNFRDRDGEKQRDKKLNGHHLDDSKLAEMDTKLRNIEDLIVDEALKYTGAHEGITDSKQVQEVKDKVISRLAAAYSLEKMRKALGEFKISLAKQRNNVNNGHKSQNEEELFADKRVAVPRKEAIAPEELDNEDEQDNKIKCSQHNEDCIQTSMSASVETHLAEIGKCSRIQQICSDFGSTLGRYGVLFEEACSLHQVCLLCSDNSYFSSVKQCNFYLSKAVRICGGDLECQKAARQSIRYLMTVSQSFGTTEPSGDCELICNNRRRR